MMDTQFNVSELNSSTSFLGNVAKACLDRYGDLSGFCFIFPSRRAATFFQKHLAQLAGDRVLIAPETLAVGDFMARVAEMEVAPRTLQIMQLYRSYRTILGKEAEDMNSEDALLSFDRFVSWAEVIASDFSELDMYDADQNQMFRNIREYNEICSDYLDDEQKDALEKAFGVFMDRDMGDNERSMWKHFNQTDNKSELKRKFLEIWRVLPELYGALNETLENAAYPTGTPGHVYRRAMRRVLDRGRDAIPWKHIVVVGLDKVSITERRIYEQLAKEKDDEWEAFADFFWDIAGMILNDRHNRIASEVMANRRAFPEPAWAAETMKRAEPQKRRIESRCHNVKEELTDLPEITEIGVPSNVMQVKVAAAEIRRLLTEGLEQSESSSRVAVVLPDESLLLPLLHSLPLAASEEDAGTDDNGHFTALHALNLTMGWSMRYTATATFMYHLERILRRCIRGAGGTVSYLASDLRTLAGQPLVHVLAGLGDVSALNDWMDKTHSIVVTPDEVREHAPELAKLLSPAATGNLAESVRWLSQRLLEIDGRLAELQARERNEEERVPQLTTIKSGVERMQLRIYMTALSQLAGFAANAGIGDMHFVTLFHLLSRMVGSETISFEGHPLSGLQVMGMLETRALDFDRVIILSMNDSVMPSKVRKRSFIPENLRRDYGLPGLNDEEKRYAYWFYRLLSRARKVNLIYDSRVGEGMRSGGKSRFLMQLEKLYARDLVREQCTFGSKETESMPDPIAKSEDIMAELERYKESWQGDENDRSTCKKWISASALQQYLKCGLAFYYRYVLGYDDTSLVSDTIDNASLGTIFHNVMLELYMPEEKRYRLLRKGITIDAEMLNSRLGDPAKIRDLVRRNINTTFYHMKPEKAAVAPLTVSMEHIASHIVRQVMDTLRHDLTRAPFRLLGSEILLKQAWEVAPGLRVNMKAKLDRVDNDMSDYSSEALCRIVDFKTGEVHLQLRNMDSLRNADYKAGNVLQLLLYAHMLGDELKQRSADGEEPAGDTDTGDIEMVVFDVNKMYSGAGVVHPYSGSRPGVAEIYSKNAPVVEEFLDFVKEKIAEILDAGSEFRPAEDPAGCDFCAFRQICGRQ